MTGANKAKAEVKADPKQRKIGLSWVLRSSPPKEKAKMPSELPAAPERKKRKLEFQAKTSSTRDRPEISQDAAIMLEVRSVVNAMIDTVVAKVEREEETRTVEVKSWLNSAIDFVIVNTKETVQAGIESIRPKRAVYTQKQKEAVIEAVDSSNETVKSRAIARLNLVPGYERVTATMVEIWKKATAPRKRGVKVNDEFESQVIGQLVYSEMEKVDEVDQAVVKANVAHSYAVIKAAAQIVQKMPFFKEDTKVQNLKFTPPWIKLFLKRSALRRRRVTANEKELPPVEAVRKRMTEIQTVRDEGNYTDDETINADETGVFYGAQPKNQYIPESAARATAPESDDKARFTSLLWGDAEGDMQASFNIIKMTVKGPNLSTSRVLDNMMLLPGFTAADGWEKRTWRRTLTLANKKKQMITQEYVRPYLFHTATAVVITVQLKAWMDTAGICMWADVQLGPHFAKKRKKCLLVWDNCGPHKVAAVREVFKEWGIRSEELPPKMTDILQVMDLIVNGPLKAGIRRARIEDLFSFFQSWKIARLQHMAKKDGTLPPAFKPPKPTLAKGLLTIFKVIKENLETPRFKQSMKQCFVHVGLSKGPDGTYAVYSPTKKGLLAQAIPQVKSSDDAVSIGEIASEVALTSRSRVRTIVATTAAAPGSSATAGSSSDSVIVNAVEVEDFTEDESDAHSSDDECNE